MLTMREVTPEGFGRKVREWNQVGLLREWREHWADRANERLHRTRATTSTSTIAATSDQGIELEPTSHLGGRSTRCARAASTPNGRAAGGGARAQRTEDRAAARAGLRATDPPAIDLHPQ